MTLSKKLKTIKTYFLIAARMCEDLNAESKLSKKDLETSTSNNTYRNSLYILKKGLNPDPHKTHYIMTVKTTGVFKVVTLI